MNAFGRCVRTLLVAAVLCEVGVLAGFLANHRRTQDCEIGAGDTAPALQGYGLDFTRGIYRPPAGCTVIRMVSSACGYCHREEPFWRRITPDLGSAHCTLVLVFPNLQDAPFFTRAASPTPQIVWVPLSWARSLRMFVTPTTLLSYRGRVVWVKQGEMDSAAQSSLLSHLHRLEDAP